ncbi:cupredoxin family protein [Chitinimonas sp.]|uniref:cupredoxin domain-containing protein n=1 Tax=Chitinimonas sp. TaxID=1934313 RepID=UPI002F9355E0
MIQPRIAPLLLLACLGAAWAHGSSEHAMPGKQAISTEQEAFGRQGDPKKVVRTVDISMSDSMRFSPDLITVQQGEVLKLRISNKGKVLHELVMGTEKDLRSHAALMQKFPNMEHSDPYMVHVPAGKTGEMVWDFNQPGEFLFGCLVPGHFEAGMMGRIKVLAKL